MISDTSTSQTRFWKNQPHSPKRVDVMRQHPEWSHEWRSLKPKFRNYEILYHHERCDGKGYPHGISGRELITRSDFSVLASVFVALTTQRPYQQAKTDLEALDFMKNYIADFLEKDALLGLEALITKLDFS